MKVVVTSQGNDLNSMLDPRFGRAKYLIVVDIETGDFQVHDNIQNLNAAQGAGIQTGRNVVNLDAEAVITGNVGPKAFRTLNAANLKIYLANNQTVKEAVDSYNAGLLKQADNANVDGHWS